MVLDYSKVNSFKPPSTTRASSSNSKAEDVKDAKRPTIPRINTESLTNTNTDCDLALITEEVVDGMWSRAAFLVSVLTAML